MTPGEPRPRVRVNVAVGANGMATDPGEPMTWREAKEWIDSRCEY